MSTVVEKLNQVLNIKYDINNAIINKGQTTTNFYSYPAAIQNIQSGSNNGMWLYNTLDEMYNATNIQQDDYALVYNLTSHNIQGLFTYNNNSWEAAKTGLTATNEYVWQNTFWGANGIDVGTLQITNNLTKDQVHIKVQVYSDLSELTLDPNITSLADVFKNRTDLEVIPYINLVNITNMSNAFYNCINLQSEAFSSITNMLPNANQLTNQYLNNIGLNINKFSNEQLRILNTKGYIDAIPESVGLTYNITYTI